MRLIHIADVHLDAPFARHAPELRGRLRDASREAFRSAISLALTQRVDAFVIAGDLFDGDTLELSTERFLTDELLRLGQAEIVAVYATGNHDPGSGSLHAGRIDWPSHVVVADGPSPITVDVTDERGEIRGRITAVGHADSRVSDDLSLSFPHPRHDGRAPEVAVLHSQVVGSLDAGSHDRYAPSELASLVRSGFDYWALGHVHRRQTLSETPQICYPGTPQGLSIRETGAHGVLLVDIPGPSKATAEFVEQAHVRWEAMEIVDPIEETTLAALVRRVERRWRELRDEDPGISGCEFIVRITIRGRTPLARELASPDGIETLRTEFLSAIGALDVEVRTRSLVPDVAWEDHRERPDVLGEALRLVEAVRLDPQLLQLDPTRLAGLRGAEGAEHFDQYIRGLLDQAEAEIAARLLIDPLER